MINLRYDIKLGKQLMNELVDLWIETKVRSDRIEQLIKQLKETKNKKRLIFKKKNDLKNGK